jgi:glycosyltransferase involved in cell wall biosynthesis
MKVCLIGHSSTVNDEGVRNIYRSIFTELKKSYDVMNMNIKDVLIYRNDIEKFNPEIIHLIVGPSSILSFIISKYLSLSFRNAKIVISAIQPGRLLLKGLINILKPDLILVQSCRSEKMFSQLGCNTRYLPNGVDIDKFKPVGGEVKDRLREKYNLRKDVFIILHVGHIKSNRNILILKNIPKEGNQVLVVGSTSTEKDRDLEDDLMKNGILLWTNYFANIEEIYALTDCYIFPTIDRFNSVETPLSVLEAMSCNLPVVSTKFGALGGLFDEGDGLYFFSNKTSMNEAIEEIKSNKILVKTREKVLAYSWESVSKKLGNIYSDLSNVKNG